jgi:hypothetical protein
MRCCTADLRIPATVPADPSYKDSLSGRACAQNRERERERNLSYHASKLLVLKKNLIKELVEIKYSNNIRINLKGCVGL